MAQLHIGIGGDDDAMEMEGREECIRLLKDIVEKLQAGVNYSQCYDINGNHCGSWSFTPSWREGSDNVAIPGR